MSDTSDASRADDTSGNSLNDPQQMEDDLMMADAEPLSGTDRPGSGVPRPEGEHEPVLRNDLEDTADAEVMPEE